ncbi:MAM and LDL-receptor class A domain-containing protein 1-like [Ptychodera flava]|uniref:MAM and LDL-receptor class A domain-containing protein 1-like n=1 Tax=Ptychodera flava TaxID=63121 RepID=UPI003969BC80
MEGWHMLLSVLMTFYLVSGTLGQFDCTFETGLCGWSQSSGDEFDWTRQQGETDSPHTGPSGDHTIGDNGWYVYIDNDSAQSEGDVARLVSPDVTMVGGQPKCLVFWYHMYGSQVGALNVYVQDGVVLGDAVWIRESTQGNVWRQAQANLITASSGTRQVVIEGVHGYRVHGDIAIDDVSISDGYCMPVGGLCDFEDGTLCGGTQDTTDDFDWSRSSGVAPSTDHTYGSSTGHYLSVSASDGSSGNSARFISDIYSATTPSSQCLTFYYNNHGTDIATLNVYTAVNGNLGQVLWSRNSQQGDGWIIAQVTVSSGSDFQIVFEAVLGTATSGYLAVDDFSLADGTCNNPGECDFENGRCTWTNDLVDDIVDWQMMQGPTSSGKTGPDFDHTIGDITGTYLYTEGSNTKNFAFSNLLSEPFTASPGNDKCLGFWYYMYGEGVESLLVYMVVGDVKSLIWSQSGNQGAQWVYASIGVTQAVDYQIQFTSVKGEGSKTDMAIDDITFTDGFCTATPVQFACTFESDLCGWTQSTKDDFDWTRQLGDTGTPHTGPSQDHTIGDAGWFLYIENSDPQVQGDVAQLVSPAVSFVANEAQCLQFWYHMYGAQIEALNIYTHDGNTMSDPIWTKRGTQGDVWKQGQVNIMFTNDTTTQVVIEGVHGYRIHGEIAVDDVSITLGYCDSGDICDFEDSVLCGGSQDTTDDFDWTLASGGIPVNDHTYASVSGHYLAVQSCTTGQIARFISEKYTRSSGSRCLTFYYNSDGADVALLNVYAQVNDNLGQALWSRNFQQGDGWIIAQVTIDSADRYEIVFEAVCGSGKSGYVAVDDFFLSDGACNNPGACDFENGMCTWSNELDNDETDWELMSGPTDTSKTGPDTDHTYGNITGTYIYTESSNTAGGTLSMLVSEPFIASPGSDKCLQFWYNMYGAGIGTLQVEQISGDTRTTLWSIMGDQGTGWQFGRIGFKQYNDYQLVFTSRRRGTKGDIGLDDITIGDGYCSASPAQIPCTFENDLCGWTQSSSDVFDWTRNQGETDSPHTGPSKDHTIGDGGWYMYIENDSSYNKGDTAQLVSTFVYMLSDQPKCLTFWYHMYGSQINQLNVYLQVGTVPGLPVWTSQGTQGDVWRNARVNLISTTDGNRQVVLEGVHGYRTHGDIAIDDVSIIDGYCQSDDVCDFEDTVICGGVQDTMDDFDWTLGSGGILPTLPNDHTYATASGHYLYIQSGNMGDKARYWSPTYTPLANKQCLQFFYNNDGEDIATLNVYTAVNGNLGQVLWSRNSQQGDGWIIAQVTVSSGSDFQIVFEAVLGTATSGYLAIDDFSMADGECYGQGDCDFENGLCTWSNELVTDELDWVLNKGSTTSSKSGPDADHTLGNENGTYIYAETSNAAKNINAVLVSEPFMNQPGTYKCLEFWYHMRGTTVGILDVDQMVGKNKSLVWSLSGEQGNDWLYGRVSLSQKSDYQIMFTMTTAGNQGDIGLDDIAVTDGYCSPLPDGAAPTVLPTSAPTTAARVTTTPTSMPIGPDNCDFETGICDWSQVSTDDFDWTRFSGSTPTAGTGPSGDHTTGSGYYMYIEADSQLQGNKAQLISTPVIANQDACFHFWYHMYGSHMGTLTVYTASGSVLGSPLWTRSGMQGSVWRYASVTISTRDQFQIVIEGIIGESFEGDIAIDDVRLDFGQCPQVTPSPGASPRYCDFENSYVACGYTQEYATDDFDWTEGSGGTSSTGTGPSVDHSTGTAAGIYLYTETSAPRDTGDRTVLYTGSYPQTTGDCLEFWYHMYGSDIGELNVYSQTSNQLSNLLWSRSGDFGDRWNLAQVSLATSDTYQVAFESVRGDGSFGDVALDDVTVNVGACGSVGECTFEKIGCTWTNVQSGDDFDWIVGSGSTITDGTGPSIDHTTGSSAGKYLFLESSNPRTPGEVARLVSLIMEPTIPSGHCLKFWYHMNGTDIGALRVVLKEQFGREQVIWELSTGDDDVWFEGQVGIDTNQYYELFFEGVIGAGELGDIAVDDISFGNSYCGVQPIDAVPTSVPTVPPTTTAASTAAPLPFDCDFETDTCGWSQGSGDDFDWTRSSGSTSSLNTGPSFDHTKGDSTGFYMYIETSSPRVAGEVAYLYSPEVVPTSGTKCLQFWYHMYGQHVDTLNVYVETGPSLTTPVWTRTGTYGDVWLEGQITIATLNRFKVVFEGTVGTSFEGDIALDDISIIDGDCPSNPSYQLCSFESSTICGYTQDASDDFDWILDSGGTPSTATGPSIDHTYGTSAGFYMYTEASAPAVAGDVARLMTPLQTATGNTTCLEFWYHMYGTTMGTLNVYVMKNGQLGTAFWSQSQNLGDQWNLGRFNYLADSPYQIVFEGIVGSSYESDIAIDDVLFTSGDSCTLPGACDFEKSICFWQNELSTDDFDWTRQSGATSSLDTGPSIDHTTGTSAGYYVYIETSAPRVIGEEADFVSELLDATSANGTCLHFWYHMYGPTVGTLQVIVRPVTGSQMTIWAQSGDQGDQWLEGQVRIDSTYQYRVVFVGTVGSSFTGDIALDDITFDDAPCPIIPNDAVPMTTLPPTTLPPVPGACNFENDICRWQNELSTDDFDWTRQSGATSSLDTGPSIDHTTGTSTGYYVYIETSSPRVIGEEADFVSELLDATPASGTCLHFWYHMYGQTLGTLQVIVRPVTGSEVTIWTLSGDQGDQWFEGQVRIDSTYQYRVAFVGTVGSSFTGDIALDDISTDYSPCPTLPGTPPVTSDACDFESDTCAWQNELSTDDFDWTRQSGATSSLDTGPSIDHTTGTASGYYVFIETSAPRVIGEEADFVSELLDATPASGTCLHFWYHMYGPTVGTLQVIVRPVYVIGPEVTIWTMSGDKGDQWLEGQVRIDSTSQYQIRFVGTVGSSFTGDIALDDISFDNVTCPTLPSDASPPVAGSCDFENDTCTWQNEPRTDEFDWTRQSGATASLDTGPSIDHTTGTASGYYVFIETSAPRVIGEEADFVSVFLDATPVGGVCLHFWYHMYGPTVGTLQVIVRPVSGSEVAVWTLSGDKGDQWLEGQVRIDSSDRYQVVFIGTVGSSFTGDIALDDIVFDEATCPTLPIDAAPSSAPPTQSPVDCDFEGGSLCSSWSQATDDDFDWTWTTGSTPSTSTGPGVDHTTGTDQGGYIFIESSNPRVENDTARIESSTLSNTANLCLQFWYHMYGPDVGTLNVYIQENSIRGNAVWTRKGTHGDVWHYGYYNLPILNSFQIVFEGVRGIDYRGDISLDDITLTAGVCPVPAEIDCDFEDDHICGYSQDSSDDFDWSRGSGDTLSNNTGPSYDHTLGTDKGHYMYIEASSPRVAGDVARMMTVSQPATSGQCLEFWYHMYGSKVGTLNVYAMDGNQTQSLLLSIDGGQGDMWWPAPATVSSLSAFQIVFEAIVGGSYSGDIAIDDVQITDGACQTTGDCDFEGGSLCSSWSQATDDDFDWTWTTGSTPSTSTGPGVDHTTGTDQGGYIFIESSNPRVENDTARIESSTLSNTANLCLQFWYHMYGPDVGTLNVYIQENSIRGNAVWTRKGTHGDVWHYGYYNLPILNSFQIIFEGVRGIDYRGDISLDDITLTAGVCPVPAEIDCDFEDDHICGYSQDSSDDFDWSRGSGDTLSNNTGPSYDHTFGTDKGHYMYIEASSPRVAGDVARMMTVSQPATSGQCLGFWYHMYGSKVGTLNVYAMDGNQMQSLLWSIDDGQGDTWWAAQATLSSPSDFQIVFEGIVGGSFSGDIAIDDVQITDGACQSTGDCSFEGGSTCLWSNTGSNDDFDWLLGQGSTNSDFTGPAEDHTTGTNQGYYMFIETSAPRVAGDLPFLKVRSSSQRTAGVFA